MATTTRIAGQLVAGQSLKLNKFTLATVIQVNDLPGSNEVEIVTSHGRMRMLACALVLEGATLPIAAAGNDQASGVGVKTVNGSGSSSPDGSSFRYAWTLTVKPGGSAAVLTTPNAVSAGFTADVTGTYTCSLVVTDQYGLASAADTVNIVIS